MSLQLVAFATVGEIVQKTHVAHVNHQVPSVPIFVTREEEIILSAPFCMSCQVTMSPAMISSTRLLVLQMQYVPITKISDYISDKLTYISLINFSDHGI